MPDQPEPTETTIEAEQQRYIAAAHAMQSGVAARIAIDPKHADPKDLRVGVNSAMVEHSALALLLVAKGVITEAEYFAAIADGMERERDSYEHELTAHHGVNIHLS